MKILHRTCQLALSGLLLVGLGSISCTVAFAQTSPVVDSGWDSPTNTSLSAAGRFLNQATFGPTVNNILYVESNGIAASVDEQLGVAAYQIPLADPNPETLGDCGSFACDTEYYWWNDILFGQDQLRQRVAYELSKLFVISLDSVDARYLPNYLNILSNDAFGNWLTLMQDVTLSPAMGTYLDMANSAAPSAGQHADENYARELMQLFSIGTYKLNQDGSLVLDSSGNPVPNYTSAIVQNFALAYTGWTWANNDCSAPTSPRIYYYALPFGQNCPMTPIPSLHSTVSKTLLRGTVLPAGQSAQQDLTAALQNVFNDPSLPPFVCRRLIQSLIKSNPSPAYISRMAAVFINDGTGVRGNMKAVIRAILLDPEARADDDPTVSDPTGGRLKDPVEWWASIMRAGQATSGATLPYVGFYNQIFDDWLNDLDETPHNAPTVFSFYSPDFQVQGTNLYGPGFQNENVNTVVWMGLHLQDAIDNNFGTYATTNNEFSLNLGSGSFFYQFAAQNGPTGLVNILDAVLMHGSMTEDMYQTIVSELQGQDPATMVKSAVYLIVTSPQYRIVM
jgi:uncharacterized protein (DUF1800 family)